MEDGIIYYYDLSYDDIYDNFCRICASMYNVNASKNYIW